MGAETDFGNSTVIKQFTEKQQLLGWKRFFKKGEKKKKRRRGSTQEEIQFSHLSVPTAASKGEGNYEKRSYILFSLRGKRLSNKARVRKPPSGQTLMPLSSSPGSPTSLPSPGTTSEEGLLAEVKGADASGMRWVRAVNEKRWHEERRDTLEKNYVAIFASISKHRS